MNSFRFSVAALVAALAFSGAALAQSGGHATAPSAGASPSAGSAELAQGEVRKVDKEGRKLTLKHGPLKSLDMPAMTMVFRVKDDAMLDKVQAGDKVRFHIEKIDGKLTVTQIEPAA